MIRDFRTYDGDGEVASDICVAGGGAAGITLALALAGSAQRVVVLESGGFDYEDEVQALYRGRNIGRPYLELDATRLRYFGGSTNHWGGMCAPLDERDFLARSWIPYSGWPIRRADLEPFYPRAHELLELGPFGYQPEWLEPAGGLLPLSDQLVDRVFRFSAPPTYFGETYRAELQAASNVDIWLHANLVDIELDVDGNVEAFVVRNLEGRQGRVRARAFVLALGGIENARILLSCDRAVPGGIGNQHDLVGRFFMEHPGGVLGHAVLTTPGWEAAYLRGHHPNAGGGEIQHLIAPSDSLQRSAGILNIAVAFGEVTQVRQYAPGYGALYDIKQALQDGRLPEDLGAHLWVVVTDLGGIARGVWERLDSTTFISVESEQAPNPDSRVLLDQERDALGLRRVVLDWRLSELDYHTMRTMAQTIAQELGRLGVARVQLREWLRDDEVTWPDDLSRANHHMGTTRMADDPRRGVVDRDSRVFGHDNLYVAGSSVFPTSGCANPTLSIVALTLRLAAHLAGPASAPRRGAPQAP
jgi:choline dehydrogenase-like flavoprotein